MANTAPATHVETPFADIDAARWLPMFEDMRQSVLSELERRHGGVTRYWFGLQLEQVAAICLHQDEAERAPYSAAMERQAIKLLNKQSAAYRDAVADVRAQETRMRQQHSPVRTGREAQLMVMLITAQHLVACGVDPDEVIAAITPPPMPIGMEAPVTGAHPVFTPEAVHVAHRAGTFIRVGLRKAQRWAAKHQPRPAPQPPAPARPTAFKDVEHVSQPARTQLQPATRTQNTPLAPSGALDGRRLNKSLVGTWLGLVLFSWVGLVWGTLLSIPFGVGLALAVSFVGGLVMVPLWGTVWGFFSMRMASDSTLAAMGFSELAPEHSLHREAARLAAALDIPVPKIGIIPANNAFAIGTSHRDAAIAIGEPLLQKLTVEEVNAVLAHEFGHIVSGDMRRMVLMRTFQNSLVWFAMFQGMKQVVRWILSWAAELWIMSFSRHREFMADAIAATLTSKEAMIGALKNLQTPHPLSSAEVTHARFMFHTVFATHPPIGLRIKALEAETYMRNLPRQRQQDA